MEGVTQVAPLRDKRRDGLPWAIPFAFQLDPDWSIWGGCACCWCCVCVLNGACRLNWNRPVEEFRRTPGCEKEKEVAIGGGRGTMIITINPHSRR